MNQHSFPRLSPDRREKVGPGYSASKTCLRSPQPISPIDVTTITAFTGSVQPAAAQGMGQAKRLSGEAVHALTSNGGRPNAAHQSMDQSITHRTKNLARTTGQHMKQGKKEEQSGAKTQGAGQRRTIIARASSTE